MSRLATRSALDQYVANLVGPDKVQSFTFAPLDRLVDAIIAAELRALASSESTPAELRRRADQLDELACDH